MLGCRGPKRPYSHWRCFRLSLDVLGVVGVLIQDCCSLGYRGSIPPRVRAFAGGLWGPVVGSVGELRLTAPRRLAGNRGRKVILSMIHRSEIEIGRCGSPVQWTLGTGGGEGKYQNGLCQIHCQRGWPFVMWGRQWQWWEWGEWNRSHC